MKTRKGVPARALARAIEKAKSLVEGHADPSVPPGDRLREIGKKLGVTRIEGGASRAAGFLARESDGTLAVYYANDMLERRRFTVAHELAHLILDKYHKHLSSNRIQSPLAGRHIPEQATLGAGEIVASRPGSRSPESPLKRHSSALEKAVDRIAAELLMPRGLVIPLMRESCRLERESSSIGLIDKRNVVRTVGRTLGVSEWALVLRLQEMMEILAVRLEFQWAKGQQHGHPNRVGVSNSVGLRIESYPFPTQPNLEGKDGWELPVRVRSTWGERTIRCQAWRRPALVNDTALQVTWAVGWTWNAFPIPEWDDSEGRAGAGQREP
jgi:Zn-dependent peptidase ImmA (M78 family)